MDPALEEADARLTGAHEALAGLLCLVDDGPAVVTMPRESLRALLAPLASEIELALDELRHAH